MRAGRSLGGLSYECMLVSKNLRLAVYESDFFSRFMLSGCGDRSSCALTLAFDGGESPRTIAVMAIEEIEPSMRDTYSSLATSSDCRFRWLDGIGPN